MARKTPGSATIPGSSAARRLTSSALVVAGGTAGAILAAATPALAIGERGDPGGGLTWVQTVLIYVGIPVAAFLVIAFLVFLPSIVRGPRYRPGRAWTAGSVWFGGTQDAASSSAEITTVPASTSEGGGASARW